MVTENLTMQKEKDFFLQVLADYLNKRTTTVPDNLNWLVLERIGQAHQLSGIIYHQCKNSIVQSDLPMKVKTRWKQEYIYNFLLYSKRLEVLKQIDAEFQKENIPYLIFKGTEVAKLYPVPGQRTMSDSDLLVHEKDKQRAYEALVRLGFEMNFNNSNFNEWHLFKNKITIELHHRLFYDVNVELESIKNWGEKVWAHVTKQNNQAQRKLDLTYHLVYTMLHLRRHLIIEGIGFRQFMDVAILASQPDINWQQAELWFNELNLGKLSQVCFAFCKKWFDIQVPICKLELEDDFYNVFTEKMLAGGVFGLKVITTNVVFNEVHFAKSSSISGMLKYAFLPYEKMRPLPYCRFLEGRPWLLPVAWCWRFVYRIGKLVPLLKGAYSKDTMKKNEDMLTKWGL